MTIKGLIKLLSQYDPNKEVAWIICTREDVDTEISSLDPESVLTNEEKDEVLSRVDKKILRLI